MLARILSRPTNLLILDEPTNDLDIETLDLLQEIVFLHRRKLCNGDKVIIDREYGLLEIGVAALAAATSFLLPRLAPVHAFAATRLAPDSPALAAVRLALAAAVIVPPTLLMGATLPAMTRAVKLTKRAARVGFDWPSTDEVLATPSDFFARMAGALLSRL